MSSSTPSRAASPFRWTVAVVLAGLVWRVGRFAAGYPMWGDEAFVAVNFFTHDFRGMAGHLDHGMVAPVVFMWLNLALSRVLGTGECALRVLPMLYGVVALGGFATLARRWLRPHAALVAVAFFAAAYYPGRHGAEVKPYTLDLLTGLAITALATSLLAHVGCMRRWMAFAALLTAAVWCSYTAAFVGGGALLVLAPAAIRQARASASLRAVGGCAAAAVAFAASFAVMYRLVGAAQQWSAADTAASPEWAAHFPPLAQPWLIPWWLLTELTGNMLAYPVGGRSFASTATLVLVVCGARSLVQRRRGAWVLLLLAPLVPMFVAAALHKHPFGGSARTTLHLAVPVCLLAGEGLMTVMRAALGARRAAVGARVCAAAMIALALGLAAASFRTPWKDISDERCREAVVWLNSHSDPTDTWAIFGDFRDDAASPPGDAAPNLSAWGGSAARLRYQVLARRGARPVRWAGTAPFEPGWLIALRDPRFPFPEAAWTARKLAAKQSFPAPEEHTARLEDGSVLEFLRVGPG